MISIFNKNTRDTQKTLREYLILGDFILASRLSNDTERRRQCEASYRFNIDDLICELPSWWKTPQGEEFWDDAYIRII